ncbi:multiple edematous wings isoform X2 [Arctopsyche grandis]|uniref:multiple edematous wings isoform X2 n=1 Tax=Arctopsyche grandis TaxID=121162 RepID=UPI00406D971B
MAKVNSRGLRASFGSQSLLFLFLLSCYLCLVEAFNLEVRVPIIKQGHEESYFGYSVAQHQTQKENESKSWLLVGAPLDQNLQPNTSKSGALWKCPLTSRLDDCEQVPTDGRRAIDSNELQAPNPDEIKHLQWLGVSVKSQGIGGKVVVCAHRYIIKIRESQFGQGLCYTLNDDLEYNDIWEPCRGRSTQREHEEFGYCQVGTSSTLLEDGTLIIGSPGPHTWRGTVFIIDTNENFLQRDQNIYISPLKSSPVEKYSYLGMAVTGGKYLGSTMSYAAGAPRSNGTGQVVIFSKDKNTKQSILSVNRIIDGEQFASNFGYEITTADLNGDGKPDLIIGAPFYFTRDSGGAVYIYINTNNDFKADYSIKLTGKIESRFGFAIANTGDLNKDGCDDLAVGSPYEDSGFVYIYLGSRTDGLDVEPKQVIRGDKLPVPLKTFGYSLSGGMDMDNNGYPDLLVGAYEQNSVALLRARPIIDIKTSVNRPETLKNIDPSKHGCPLDPQSNLTCFTFEICCAVESLKQSTLETLILNYVIEAETFSGTRKFSRVFFGNTNPEIKTNVLKRNIELSKINYKRCQEHVVYIKENTRDIQSPIGFHVNYTIVQKEPQWSSETSLLPQINRLPILNATRAILTFEGLLLRDCGDDDICESDLVIEAELKLPKKQDSYVLALGEEEELKLSVIVGNNGESAYQTQLFVEHHKGLNYIAANAIDKHVICKMHNETLVICPLGNPFKKNISEANSIILRFDPKSLEDHESSISFRIWANSTSQEINPNKAPIHVTADVVKNAELAIRGSARPEQVFYGGEVKGESAMKYLDDIGSTIVHIYQVFNLGPWRVNSVEVGIDWPHQIANNKDQGKWLFYLDGIPIVEGDGVCTTKNANPLGLNPKPSSKDAPPANLVQPHFATKSNNRYMETSNYTSRQNVQSEVRLKRDVEMVVKPEAYVDKDGTRRPIINMNCISKTAKCIKIRCTLFKLAPNQEATIRIQGRLWNSSLVEDYPNVQEVSVSSMARLSFQKSHNIHQNNLDDDIAIVSTKALPDLVVIGPANFMWWMILAILLGLLVLIGLILVLWKLGFFKRKKYDGTISGNVQKPESRTLL